MTYTENLEKTQDAYITFGQAMRRALQPVIDVLVEFWESVRAVFETFADLLPRCRFCDCILILTVSYTCDRCGGPSRFWQPWMAVRAP